MIWAVNYANERFSKAQKLNTKTAYKNDVDKVLSFSPKDIDSSFYEKNKVILESRRGNGYWLWKPYFIGKALNQIPSGDWLIYSDAGSIYTNSVKKFLKSKDTSKAWMICQEAGFPEYCYTKRDAFIYMDKDYKQYTHTTQRAAGVLLIRKCEESSAFISEWLKWACDFRIISDSPNTCGLENYGGFVENRHDQSVFSLLSKKYAGILVEPNFFSESVSSEYTDVVVQVHRTNCGSRLELYVAAKFGGYWIKIKSIIKKKILANKVTTNFLKKIGIKKKFLYGDSVEDEGSTFKHNSF